MNNPAAFPGGMMPGQQPVVGGQNTNPQQVRLQQMIMSQISANAPAAQGWQTQISRQNRGTAIWHL